MTPYAGSGDQLSNSSVTVILIGSACLTTHLCAIRSSPSPNDGLKNTGIFGRAIKQISIVGLLYAVMMGFQTV